jgi:hypothetical protein
LQILQTEAFGPRVGEAFDMDMGGATTPLTLVQVQPLTLHVGGPQRRAPFSLIFRSQSQIVFPQKTYRLTNATVGAIEVFLVPVGREAAGVVYQAVFN